MFLSFETKTLMKNMFSYFSFVLALKTIEAQMLFWSIFLKYTTAGHQKIVYCYAKISINKIFKTFLKPETLKHSLIFQKLKIKRSSKKFMFTVV